MPALFPARLFTRKAAAVLGWTLRMVTLLRLRKDICSSNQIESPCRKPSAVTGSSKKQSTRSRNACSEKSRLLHQMTARSKKKAPSSRWAPLLMGLWRNYSSISMTTPEPTVRPPSRIAKRRPFSIAIGVISSTFMSMLSPGMHISTPSGREMMPVTSVVLK